jgi:hypothetical protein
MASLIMDPMRGGNRRIGDRLAIDPIEVTWVIGDPGPARRRSRRRQKVDSYTGYMIDVSVSGAAILGPSSPQLPIRSRAIIRVHDGESSVMVRRSQAAHVQGMLLYGVQFLELDKRLETEIYELLSTKRPSEESWLRSR